MIMLNIFEYYYDYVCDEECGNAYDDSDSSCNDEDSCYDRDDHDDDNYESHYSFIDYHDSLWW